MPDNLEQYNIVHYAIKKTDDDNRRRSLLRYRPGIEDGWPKTINEELNMEVLVKLRKGESHVQKRVYFANG